MAKIFKISATQKFRGETTFNRADDVYIEAVSAKHALERAEKHYRKDPLVEENGKEHPCTGVQVEHLEMIISDFVKL